MKPHALPDASTIDTERRTLIAGALAMAAMYVLPTSPARAAETPPATHQGTRMSNSAPHEPARDFDFYFGRWNVHNRRLKERLTGSTEWEEFDAQQSCRPILGGMGNEDEFVTDAFDDHHFIGITIRLFDPQKQEWSIYWMDNRRVRMEPPVVGRFERGVGTFYGRDQHKGVPVLARFIWSDIKPDSARWEQALSTDEGNTWETNWVMRMRRVSA